MKKNVQVKSPSVETSNALVEGLSSSGSGASNKKRSASEETRNVAKKAKRKSTQDECAVEAAPVKKKRVLKETPKDLFDLIDDKESVSPQESKKRVAKTKKSDASKREAAKDAPISEADGVDQKKKKSIKKTSKKELKGERESEDKTVAKRTVRSSDERKRSVKKAEQNEKPIEQDAEASRAIRVWNETRKKIANFSLSVPEQKRREEYERLKRENEESEAVGAEVKLPFWDPGWLWVRGARQHNLKSIDVPFPLSAFTVVTGASGSGKSSLVEDVLYRYLARLLNRSQIRSGACDEVVGYERVNKVIRVDQTPIGQSPSSNAATYTGVFDLIRQVFARTSDAQIRGFSARRFSFNAPGGRCEKCEGAGVLKVEMHFLADIWIVCDACGGKRYDSETLQVKYRGKTIADVLETTCGEALALFSDIPAIARVLRSLCDIGLDYLPLGQSATTLSGGEAQRVKLASELSRVDSGRTVYILDEPTTGLHFEDVRKLLDVIHRLVDLGNTAIVVEHNLDVVKNADWLIELGPEAGLEGGRLVFAGTPEQLLEYTAKRAASSEFRDSSLRSYTGEALVSVFERGSFIERAVLDPDEYWASVKRSAPSDAESESSDEAKEEGNVVPWELDGKRWHTEFRVSRNGDPCRWEGRCLKAIVERIEESPLFAETDWNYRNYVEIRSARHSSLWFMRATTNEEWLLKLRFRTARNTFGRELLLRKLDLRPLNEIDEIPLYGTQPRVKLETVGAWQEVELKVFSFAEIDREEFWDFLNLALEQFGKAIESADPVLSENGEEKTTGLSGRERHLAPCDCYGQSSEPLWDILTLHKLVDIVETLSPDGKGVWENATFVPFYLKGKKTPWVQFYTKNCEYLSMQINLPRERGLELMNGSGVSYELGESESVDLEAVFIRFKADERPDLAAMKRLLENVRDLLLDE